MIRDRGPRALLAVRARLGVDRRPDEEPDDLLAVLDREAGVEPATDLGEEIDGGGRRLVRLPLSQRFEATLDRVPFSGDSLELWRDVGLLEDALGRRT